jgi:hypothetical protein
MKRSKRRHSKRSKKRSKRRLHSKRSNRNKKISRLKRRSNHSSKKVTLTTKGRLIKRIDLTRRLRTRLSPSGVVEKKEDCIDPCPHSRSGQRPSESFARAAERDHHFYVLGLCSCDTRQQRDEIDKVIKDLQEKTLLPKEPYEVHMINHVRKHQRPGCVPNESANVFNKRFLFEFGRDPLPDGIEKHKYSVIFNHYCPYMVLTDNIPLVNEMLRTDYSTRPYLINPVSKIPEDGRYDQLMKSFDLIVSDLEAGLDIRGAKKKWSVYQLKE